MIGPRTAALSGFDDPDGARFGVPTYPWRCAPDGLATLRQLRARGLRPGGQDVAGQICRRRRGDVLAGYLYRIDRAVPHRPASPAQLSALASALRARQTCPTCTRWVGYVIPTRYSECLDCADTSSTLAGAA